MKIILLATILGSVSQVSWAGIFEILEPPVKSAAFPPNFPLPAQQIYRQDFENWSHTIHSKGLWTAVPRTPDDVVKLANWAVAYNYTLRAFGKRHNWSPLVVTQTPNPSKTLLVDIRAHLKSFSVHPNGTDKFSFPVITSESGTLMEDLLTELERYGLGLTATAGIGKITVGGLLAVAGHGNAIRVEGSPEHLKQYGSVSNIVVEVTAVAWDAGANAYTLRVFNRSMEETSFLMANLGQAFITSVTLQVQKNYLLRCRSYLDIPNEILYAEDSGNGTRTLAGLVAQSGRAMVFSFPYLEYSWVVDCNVVNECPVESRSVATPYNYPFLKYIPELFSNFVALIEIGFTSFTPEFQRGEFEFIRGSIAATNVGDICGPSKNHLLYFEPETLRYGDLGYAVLTKRENLATVIHLVMKKQDEILKEFEKNWRFPLNGPTCIRTTAVDNPEDVGPTARPAFLSIASPVEAFSEFNILVWFEFLTFNGTKDSNLFYRQMEAYLIEEFDGTIGFSRSEWSKGWGVSNSSGPWTDSNIIHSVIPSRYPNWQNFINARDSLDPKRIYRNDFLNDMFVAFP